MLSIERTHSGHPDFIELVRYLDAELAERDGDEQDFLARLNATGEIRHVVVVYAGGSAVACGAIKEYEPGTMEIKRMYTKPRSRGTGIASKILAELERWTNELHYGKCILETNKNQPEAIALYKKNGYQVIPNYGKYFDMPGSVCFEKEISTVQQPNHHPG